MSSKQPAKHISILLSVKKPYILSLFAVSCLCLTIIEYIFGN